MIKMNHTFIVVIFFFLGVSSYTQKTLMTLLPPIAHAVHLRHAD